MVLDNVLKVTLLEQGLDQTTSRGPRPPQLCCEGVLCGWGGAEKPALLLSALCWLVFGQHLSTTSAHFSSRKSQCFGVAFPWLPRGPCSGVRCPHPTGAAVLVSGPTALRELPQPGRLAHIPLDLAVHCSVARGFGEHNSHPLAPKRAPEMGFCPRPNAALLPFIPASVLRSGVPRHPHVASSPEPCALQVVSITTCPGAM